MIASFQRGNALIFQVRIRPESPWRRLAQIRPFELLPSLQLLSFIASVGLTGMLEWLSVFVWLAGDLYCWRKVAFCIGSDSSVDQKTLPSKTQFWSFRHQNNL